MYNFIKKFLNLQIFTSETDQFLISYRKQHPSLSLSQQTEQEKYNKIHAMRDHACTPQTDHFIWPKF